MNDTIARNIAIIGRGKVGQSLTCLLSSRGHNVSNLGRNLSLSQAVIRSAHVIILCVNDDSISIACEELTQYLSDPCIVCHCSGSLDNSVLESAAKIGCFTASCHPLNTFPTLESSLKKFANNQHGSYLYSEGHPEALQELHSIFEDAGFHTKMIKTDSKTLYHAACVFACNYLTSLMEMSLDTAALADIEVESFWQSLQPLIQSTLKNIELNGTTAALSGPIARGDTKTLESHLSALENASQSLKINYANLGLRSLEIAEKQGQLDAQDLDAIRKVLNTIDPVRSN